MQLKRLLYCIITLIMTGGCRKEDSSEKQKADISRQQHDKKLLPGKQYHFTEAAPVLKHTETVYVPVYSDIYISTGERKYSLTATLSVRNTSFRDTMYVTEVNYYDSKGRLMTRYLKQPIFLVPMETADFIVGYSEKEGGSGANFIVKWGAGQKLKPIIQAVMISVENHDGISIVTEGVEVEPEK